MKKMSFILAAVAVALGAFALDFGSAKTVPILPPTQIGSGATNSTALAVSGFKGQGELVVYAANSARTALNITLWATNSLEGGWEPFAIGAASTNAATIVRVPFPGAYLPKDCKVEIESVGAATTASAMILTY